jgi:beta-mannosidase
LRPELETGGHRELRRLDAGWEASLAQPGGEPANWLPASVPGTIAGALRDAGRPADGLDLDAYDCWFRTSFDAEAAAEEEEVVLAIGGIATVAEVRLNGELLLESPSMFLRHELDVGSLLGGENELTIRCRALGPLLEGSRRPRARWRTKLAHGNLRFFRTMLLGRAPGFAPGPAAVGPWRPIVLERRRRLVLDGLALRPRLEGADGVLAVRARVRSLGEPLPDELVVEAAGFSQSLPVGDGTVAGELRLPDIPLWWPHTHGDPALHEVTIGVGGLEVSRLVGFRKLEPGPEYDVDEAPLALRVNGVDVFARGAVWTPPDFIGLAAGEAELREALELVRDAGMNIVRLPGTSAYESETFHDLCDELGLLVWQDFMFANFDYPIEDDEFRSLVEEEARQQLELVAGRPSLAVLCGNSEVEQQVAMLGLDPALGRGEPFAELLPALAREAGADAPYVPSAPSGGDLPFRPDRGVANYFGVGGYRRPLEDARRARVGFAAECLAIANVPDEASLEAMGLAGIPVDDARWKAGVPRDAGADWDFDDVRDWYLERLFGVDPVELRRVNLPRYLELSRAVSGEVMAEVFGEWRRPGSPCAGGQVLWLRDLAPGAGWGLVDSLGRPKAAYHHLRRVLAPVAVWTTDEGLGGIDVHVWNDRREPLHARLRVALYRDSGVRVDEASTPLELPPRGARTLNVETVLGHFSDVSWAYRFGPPNADAVVASVEDEAEALLAQAFRFPAGRPLTIESAATLGIEATAVPSAPETVEVMIRSERLLYGARVAAEGWVADDDAFCVEPGHFRTVRLRRRAESPLDCSIAATNLDNPIRVAGTAA